MTPGPAARQRLDQWLWHARVVKSRTLAQKLVAGGAVRVNGQRVTAPDHKIGTGDGLTFVIGARLRVLKVLATGARRGPAREAALLYEDISPAPAKPERGGTRTKSGLEVACKTG